MGALDNIGSSPSYGSSRETAGAVLDRAAVPDAAAVMNKVKGASATLAADQESLRAQEEAKSIVAMHPDNFGDAPAKAPEAAAPFDSKAFDDRFSADYPDVDGLGALLAPSAGQDPAFAKFLATYDAGEIFKKELFGDKAVVEIRKVYDAQGKHEEVQRDTKAVQVKHEEVQAKHEEIQRDTKNVEKKADVMSAEFENIKKLIGEKEFKEVESKAQAAVDAHPEAFKGVSREDVLSAYFVANSGFIGAGLSTADRAKFDASVNSLDRSQEAAFQKLVANLSEKDRATAEKRYNAAKEAKLMTVIDQDGKKLIIVDPKGNRAPETLEAANGKLVRKLGGSGEDGIAVVPSEDDKRAEYAAGFSEWEASLPPSLRGVVPAAKFQDIMEIFYADPSSSLHSRHSRNGESPFNPTRGFDPANAKVAALAMEDVMQEKLFVDPRERPPRISESAGPDRGRFRRKWLDLVDKVEKGGVTAMRDHLSNDWRKQGESSESGTKV